MALVEEITVVAHSSKHINNFLGSLGSVTYSEVMVSSRGKIKRVTDSMYEVKKSGKSNIRHVV